MGFLNKASGISTAIEITTPYDKATATKVCAYLQTIVSNTRPEELEIIAKISKNSAIKDMALSKAQKFV